MNYYQLLKTEIDVINDQIKRYEERIEELKLYQSQIDIFTDQVKIDQIYQIIHRISFIKSLLEVIANLDDHTSLFIDKKWILTNSPTYIATQGRENEVSAFKII